MNDKELISFIVSNKIFKFTTKEFAESFVKGNLCFNPVRKFSKNNINLTAGQFDPLDGFQKFKVRNVVFAEVLEDTKDNVISKKRIYI